MHDDLAFRQHEDHPSPQFRWPTRTTTGIPHRRPISAALAFPRLWRSIRSRGNARPLSASIIPIPSTGESSAFRLDTRRLAYVYLLYLDIASPECQIPQVPSSARSDPACSMTSGSRYNR
ncbi:hypothetical protein FA13DRAFT_1094627 [Coprinellus micaceus]|uniref:Uncharacterized protein n=1 Tax=Coprinellus micaceus TaxID=71717 RepID=A0A4Y7TSA0_COPMI|nr:hypothetical protein FA13DRAFT_1094627 [Coprinellus micaceus]